MNIRMTLTAVALGTMTLAGCSSMGNDTMMSKPAAPAAAIPGSTTPTTTSADITRRPGFDGNAPAVAPGTPANAAVTDIMGKPINAVDTSADITRRPGFYGNEPAVAPGTPANAAVTNMMGEPIDAQDTYADVTRRPGFDGNAPNEAPGYVDPSMGKDAMMANDATMTNDAMMAKNDMSANDAAMNGCFAAGGQVVNWVGDPSGATMACRQKDGLEYRLADARYYQ